MDPHTQEIVHAVEEVVARLLQECRKDGTRRKHIGDVHVGTF